MHRARSVPRFLALAVMVASSAALQPAAGIELAAPYRAFEVPDQVSDVAVVDWNRDGRPDLVAACTASPTISLLLSGNDGALHRRDLAVTAVPVRLAVGNFNGDGLPDLATVGYYSSFVSIYLGRPDGGVEEPPAVSLTVPSGVLAVADLNGDGTDDLVVSQSTFSANEVSAFLSNGDGFFGPAIVSPQPVAPGRIVLADMNGDGKPDIVSIGGIFNASLTTSIGQGDGSFISLPTRNAGPSAQGLAVADIDGDGRLDAIVGIDNVVRLFPGVGDGSFQNPVTIPLPGTAGALAVGDLDADGRLDVVAASAALLHVSGFTFGAPIPYIEPPGVLERAVVDVTGDGKADVIAAISDFYPFPDQVIVAAGHGDGTFGAGYTFPTGARPTGIAAGDLNGDGRADLAVAALNGHKIDVHMNHGDGTFAAPLELPTGDTVYDSPFRVAIGDLNGDGRNDIAYSYLSLPKVSVFFGTGGGTFGPRVDREMPSNEGNVAIGDLDGDGLADLAATSRWYSQPKSVSVFLSHRDGSSTRIDLDGGPSPMRVAIGDLNGDGHRDLAVCNVSESFLDPGTVTVLLGNGDGTFHDGVAYAAGASPTSVDLGDVNGDGHLDAVAANLGAGSVSVLLGDGTGALHRLPEVPTGPNPWMAVLGDLDEDGRADAAVASNITNVVAIHRGQGDGTLGPAGLFGSPLLPQAVVIADLDGDGHLDVAAANEGSNSVTVMRNLGVAPPDHEPPSLSLTANPSELWPANHRLADIAVGVTVQDDRDADPAVRLLSVTSSEPDVGTGDGDVGGDIAGAELGTDDRAFSVRSERAGGGSGRAYQACYEAKDASGNATVACVTISVLHDRGERAQLSASNGLLTLFGRQTAPPAIVPGSVEIGSDLFQHVATITGSPAYRDVDGDGYSDATFALSPSVLQNILSASGPLFAHWRVSGQGVLAPLLQSTLPVPGSRALAFSAMVSPNPATRDASFELTLPSSGEARVTIFDVAGNVVARPVDGWRPAGGGVAPLGALRGPQVYWYRVEWQGRHVDGKFVMMR